MIQDWMLERYRLGELTAAQKAEVEKALAEDAQLRAKLEALETDTNITLERYKPRAVGIEVRQRAASDDAPRRSLVPALALSFGLVLAVSGAVALQHRPDDIIIKGDTALRIYRHTGGQPERLEDGAKVRPHDVVQVEVELADERSLVVVSIDGAGHATLHHPSNGGDTAAPPGFKALPGAFELDEAPGFERFFLVTSNRPLDAGAVYQAAQRLARDPGARTVTLALPFAATQRSLLLDKAP
jgi:hypothetical protein